MTEQPKIDGSVIISPIMGLFETATSELRFVRRQSVSNGVARDLRILQQKWRIEVTPSMLEYEWRDVPEVEA